MFSKNDYQKATVALKKAESELARQESRLREIDLGIEKAVSDQVVIETRGASIASSERPIAEIEPALDTVAEDRIRMDRRIEEYQRMRAHQFTNVLRSKILLFEAENAVHLAQKDHYEQATRESTLRCIEVLRGPLRELEVNASALAFHVAWPKGADSAMQAWRGADALTILEQAIETIARTDSEGVEIKEVPKGAPPIEPILSTALSPEDRKAAAEILKDGPLTPERFTARLSPDPAPEPTTDIASVRMRKGQMIQYWSDRIAVIERAIGDVQARKYPDYIDGKPVDARAARKKETDQLQKLLNHARECHSTWAQFDTSKPVAA